MSVFETLKEKARDLILGESPQPLNLNLTFQSQPEQSKNALTTARLPTHDVLPDGNLVKNFQDMEKGINCQRIYEKLESGELKYTGFNFHLPKGEYTVTIVDGVSVANSQSEFKPVFKQVISIADDAGNFGAKFQDIGLAPFIPTPGKSRDIVLTAGKETYHNPCYPF